MKLIIVIEINPYDFAKNEYESPKVSLDENTEAWNVFWTKSITDSGLGHLNAIYKGSYLVDVSEMNAADWEIILQQQLEDIEWNFFEEQISKLSGGIVLKENDVFRMEPQCCGDIGMLKDWEQILESKSNNWTQLWIGHPWVYYKRNKDNIEFSEYTESSLEELKDIKTMYSVSETILKSEVGKIRTQLNELETTIQKTLEKMSIAHATRIAQLMTGND